MSDFNQLDLTKPQQEFLDRKAHLELGGGAQKIEKQHAKGRLTARERIHLLFDEDSFVEYGLFIKHRCHDFGMEKVEAPADGVITGFGKVNGRLVYAYANDATVLGGALGETQGKKVCRLMEAAIAAKAPLVALYDCGGARLQEGFDSVAFLDIFWHNVQASGYIPQFSAIMGPCAGGAAYSPALTDVIINVDQTSQMFITGPKVIEEVTGEKVDMETLGGARVHNEISGVSHRMASNDEDCIQQLKCLLSYFPQNCHEKPPVYAYDDDPNRLIPELNHIIPENPKKGYDVHRIIDLISDTQSFFEIQPLYAKNLVVGFGRIMGRTVGYVANQCSYMAGSLDINASDKGAHFINLCNAFHIPLIFLTDVPGYLPGVSQEHGGIIRHGAKMVYAVDNATVPKISLTMRKVYGGSAAAMCNTQYARADVKLCWPNMVASIMSGSGAVNVIFHKELAQAEDKETTRAQLIEYYEQTVNHQFKHAERGYSDLMILPEETRKVLIQCLESLENKEVSVLNKKSGLMPV